MGRENGGIHVPWGPSLSLGVMKLRNTMPCVLGTLLGLQGVELGETQSSAG